MLKQIIFIFIIILFLSLYILSFNQYLLYGLSSYGCIILIYFIIQLYSSYYNHKKYEKLYNESWLANNKSREFYNHDNVLVMEEPYFCILIMVGHRERKDYWMRALDSLLLLSKDNLKKIYIIIDGDEFEDQYMREIAQEKMMNSMIEYEIISINQRGKRGAMFYGLEKIKRDFPNKERNIDVVFTDSDTELQPTSLLRLQECLRSDPKNGCATGVLYIYNKNDGLLPKMIHARYRYAFTIERGASSFYGCMTCCSGPLSIYRLNILNEMIAHKFITQKFLNIKCEPGDDRHLTNLVLAQGYKARQTNFSLAGTEAPETYIRFLNQQLRWSRSFYRELYWQIKAIPKQSIYLSLITVYEFLFPFFLVIWFIKILYIYKKSNYLFHGCIISLIVLFLRTFILFFYLSDKYTLYNILYYPCYLFLLLPTKLYAFITVFNNHWVTQPRFKKTYMHCSFHYIFIFIWNIFIWTGLLRHFFFISKNNKIF